MKVPDYSNLGDDGLPLCVEVELDPKKDFKQNAKLCFKQAPFGSLHCPSSN